MIVQVIWNAGFSLTVRIMDASFVVILDLHDFSYAR